MQQSKTNIKEQSHLEFLVAWAIKIANNVMARIIGHFDINKEFKGAKKGALRFTLCKIKMIKC